MREVGYESHAGGYLEESHEPGNAHRGHLRRLPDRYLLRVIGLDILQDFGEAAQSKLPVHILGVVGNGIGKMPGEKVKKLEKNHVASRLIATFLEIHIQQLIDHTMHRSRSGVGRADDEHSIGVGIERDQ